MLDWYRPNHGISRNGGTSMKSRIFVVLTCLTFCTPLLAEDWVSLFQRQAAPVRDRADKIARDQELTAVAKRLQQENYQLAQKEVAELADLYDKDPSTRPQISTILSTAGPQRNDSAEAFKPIVPMLTAHLKDADVKTREGASMIILGLKPRPPFEVLEPLMSLAKEKEVGLATLGAVAAFCDQSKQAVFALRDAAAADQPNQKRAITLQVIGTTPCTDTELLDSVAAGLKSDEWNVKLAAVQAAGRFGPAAAPLKADLVRLAAGPTGEPLAEAARSALRQLPQ